MTSKVLTFETTVAIIGAGTMGAGIAQVAAEAKHAVILFDVGEGAAERGKQRIEAGLNKLVKRGKRSRDDVNETLNRISVVNIIDDIAPAGIVIEAIAESLDAKHALFSKLEEIVSTNAILCTNTSSISVTQIAAILKRPERFAGLHFFNPAPIMKLVEVISGLATSDDVRDCLMATVQGWGKIAVAARSTPGFIVNRVARPFYAEALRLVEEQVVDPATLDAIITGSGGFRMGPFKLMDLIGNDINYTVTCSMFDAYYQDPRFRPSLVQKELVDAGWLGQKTGRGFFDYSDGAEKPKLSVATPDNLAGYDLPLLDGSAITNSDVAILRTDGRTAAARAIDENRQVILYDYILDPSSVTHVGFAVSGGVSESAISNFVSSLSRKEISASRLPDWPGLIVLRTYSMLANEAFELILHGVADAESIDNAMRYGVNYPIGPIAWANQIGLEATLNILELLHTATGDPRYRVSFGLRSAIAEARNS